MMFKINSVYFIIISSSLLLYIFICNVELCIVDWNREKNHLHSSQILDSLFKIEWEREKSSFDFIENGISNIFLLNLPSSLGSIILQTYLKWQVIGCRHIIYQKVTTSRSKWSKLHVTILPQKLRMRFHEPNGDEQKWNEAKNRK